MPTIPHADELPDGSIRVPRETRELLYRLLGDMWQTFTIEERNDLEAMAIEQLQDLLRSKRFGPLRPLHVLLDQPPPRGGPLTRVK